ncbi:MAG TPA: TetR/AcrR family transcriptional regulator [Opitutaceae bacterium]|nr:TetR/AcrR family transcriptional regulator [Opitutaceae bacterium]
MARTKEFDEAEVLDQALELFRARGFQHTSFADLTRELGVSRQSLYDTYGDKQTLFHAALKRYLDRAIDFIRRQLADPGPVRKVLLALFDGLIAGQCSKGSPGCLMVNSMVELTPHDADIRALAQAHAREVEGLFASRLSAAQRKGEIGKTKDPVALARFLHHTLLGLSVASRALGERDTLRDSVRLALQALG